MKHYSVVFKPDAITDLKDLAQYIYDESGHIDIALNYVDKLQGACQRLALSPIRGHSRDDIRPNLRIVSLDRRAVAAFEVDEDNALVRIFGIYYGGRNYETLLNQ